MKYVYLLLTLFISSIFLSCGDNHGIEPLPGRLDLNIYFSTEDIPENTEGVYLFVAPQFPPHAINEMFLSPNSLPLGEDTVITSMELPYGHYQAIGLWWYNKNTVSNLADLFTLKFNNELLPYEFDITENAPVHQTDLWANLERVDRDASIEGTIYFDRAFPDSTLLTAVAAYSQRPTNDLEHLIYLKSMDFSVDENPFHYKLPIKGPAIIKYVVVLWLSDRSGLDDFKTVGYYVDPVDSTSPGTLRLRQDQTATDIDIHADWDNIND